MHKSLHPDDSNPSAIGRLLREISWEGKKTTQYRKGGLGHENVLTTEVFQALDFLPRRLFLGAVLAEATGADSARQQLVAEIEDAELDLLPGSQPLITANHRERDRVMRSSDMSR